MAYVGLGDASGPPVIDYAQAYAMIQAAPGVVSKAVTNPVTGERLSIIDSSKSPAWVKAAFSVLEKVRQVGGTYPIVIAGTTYTISNPKPTEAPADGYEWKYSAATGWVQVKKSGGILGAIGSVVKGVASVALPVASAVLPVVGVGGSVVKGLTTANSVVQGATSGVNAVKSVVGGSSPAPTKPIVGTLPLASPTNDSTVDQFNRGGNAIPAGLPSWVLPAAIVAGAFLLSERR